MSHQCVHCGKIYPTASKELLQGCHCGSHFFYFVKEEHLEKLKEETAQLTSEDKEDMEDDIRELIGVDDELKPVVLDFESIHIPEPGKIEIDLVNLLGKKPLVYKFEEGKYVIDLASSLDFTHKKEKIKK